MKDLTKETILKLANTFEKTDENSPAAPVTLEILTHKLHLTPSNAQEVLKDLVEEFPDLSYTIGECPNCGSDVDLKFGGEFNETYFYCDNCPCEFYGDEAKGVTTVFVKLDNYLKELPRKYGFYLLEDGNVIEVAEASDLKMVRVDTENGASEINRDELEEMLQFSVHLGEVGDDEVDSEEDVPSSREVKLEFIIQKMYDLFKMIDVAPISSFIPQRIGEMYHHLYNEAEVRSNIDELVRITVEMNDSDSGSDDDESEENEG